MERTEMNPLETKVGDLLTKFDQSHDPAALREAGLLLRSAPVSTGLTTAENDSLGRGKLRLWLTVLDRLDQELDRGFNPEDAPELTVVMPFETGIPSGLDPSEVRDPAARAVYGQAIQANQAKAERYNRQRRLHDADEELTPEADRFVTQTFLPIFGSREFERTVQDRVTSPARKAGLLKLGRPARD
jgi:hypothetical protein